MSEEDSGTGGVDLAASLGRVRGDLASLDQAIAELRGEADRLTRQAASRTVLKSVEPPADPPEPEEAIAAFGRHAANVVDEFDPRPFDPDEDPHEDRSADQEPVGAPGGAFDGLAAPAPEEPGPAPEADAARLPPVDLDLAPAWRVERPEPEAVIGAGDDGDTTVLESAPTGPQPGGPPTLDPPAEPAFGLLPSLDDGADAGSDDGAGGGEDDGDGSGQPEAASDVEAASVEAASELEAASASDAGSMVVASEADAASVEAASDGLDAIAASESTDVPPDWDRHDDDDDAAFDKFFHADVEPEPAQRWLLND